MAAQADFDDRHRNSDMAKILDDGFLRVYRYRRRPQRRPPPG